MPRICMSSTVSITSCCWGHCADDLSEKIAPARDIKPTLAMGVTMNHISAVTSPLVGGLVWIKLDYRLVFISGVAFALIISLIVTQWMQAQPIMVKVESEFAD